VRSIASSDDGREYSMKGSTIIMNNHIITENDTDEDIPDWNRMNKMTVATRGSKPSRLDADPNRFASQTSTIYDMKNNYDSHRRGSESIDFMIKYQRSRSPDPDKKPISPKVPKKQTITTTPKTKR
jgi:hypothetical protein